MTVAAEEAVAVTSTPVEGAAVSTCLFVVARLGEDAVVEAVPLGLRAEVHLLLSLASTCMFPTRPSGYRNLQFV